MALETTLKTMTFLHFLKKLKYRDTQQPIFFIYHPQREGTSLPPSSGKPRALSVTDGSLGQQWIYHSSLQFPSLIPRGRHNRHSKSEAGYMSEVLNIFWWIGGRWPVEDLFCSFYKYHHLVAAGVWFMHTAHQSKYLKVETAIQKGTKLFDTCSASESLALKWKDIYVMSQQVAFYHLLIKL